MIPYAAALLAKTLIQAASDWKEGEDELAAACDKIAQDHGLTWEERGQLMNWGRGEIKKRQKELAAEAERDRRSRQPGVLKGFLFLVAAYFLCTIGCEWLARGN